MRIAVMIGPMSLGPRPGYDFANFRTTPGMTGTDQGFIRIAECLHLEGHAVELIVPSEQTEHAGMTVRRSPEGHYDAALSINEPDLLRAVDADVRACAVWLNDFSFCRAGFDRYVDLFISPSAAHLEQFRTRPSWRRVEVSQANPNGVELFQFREEKWRVVQLGVDPERYGTRAPGTADESPQWLGVAPKIPGRVVYCSSPDRGLHHLLQEWPAIKAAQPHATLHIFYRLGKWIQDLASVPYPFPSIEALRARALYINEALGRMSDPKWGITVRDSVSRETIEREMAQAECLAYPCDTIRWSEGFSCTILEACAARACPVVMKTDALPDVYGGVVPMYERTEVASWRDGVIAALQGGQWRESTNNLCEKFAAARTWEVTAGKMLEEIIAERSRKNGAVMDAAQ